MCRSGARLPNFSNDWTQATNPLPPAVSTVNVNAPTNVNVIYWPSEQQELAHAAVERAARAPSGNKYGIDLAYVGTKMSNLATAFNANAVQLGSVSNGRL